MVSSITAVSQSNEAVVNNGEDEGSEGSDDDSDDDGIKVTIDKDKIEAAKSSYQNMQVCIWLFITISTKMSFSAEEKQCYRSRFCALAQRKERKIFR